MRMGCVSESVRYKDSGEFKMTISKWPSAFAFPDPFLNLVNASTLIDAFKTNEINATACTHALAYCVALRIMSDEPIDGLAFQKQIENEFGGPGPMRRILMRERKRSLYLPAEDPSHHSAFSPKVLMQRRIQAFVTLGLFPAILRRQLEIPYYRSLQRGGDFRQLSVPTSNSIPFHSIMDAPLPFSPNATIDLASCHLAKMATTDFLGDGEWARYYSRSEGPGEYQHFYPSIRRIQIVATAGSDSASTLNLHGTGKDGIGAFDLDGKTLVLEIGQILLRKVYVRGPVWDWACIMTPMGIFGSWGLSCHGGWIWLWKTAWTAGL